MVTKIRAGVSKRGDKPSILAVSVHATNAATKSAWFMGGRR